MPDILVQPFTTQIVPDLLAHLQRHRAESDNADIHFMPFAPDDQILFVVGAITDSEFTMRKLTTS